MPRQKRGKLSPKDVEALQRHLASLENIELAHRALDVEESGPRLPKKLEETRHASLVEQIERLAHAKQEAEDAARESERLVHARRQGEDARRELIVFVVNQVTLGAGDDSRGLEFTALGVALALCVAAGALAASSIPEVGKVVALIATLVATLACVIAVSGLLVRRFARWARTGYVSLVCFLIALLLFGGAVVFSVFGSANPSAAAGRKRSTPSVHATRSSTAESP